MEQRAEWGFLQEDWPDLQTRRGLARMSRDEENRMKVALCAMKRWDEVFHRG